MSPHTDPETLALSALGEPAGSTEATAHLVSCSQCRAELDRLVDVIRVGRMVTPDDHPVSPPPAVWERVRLELGLADAPAAADSGAAATSPTVVTLRRRVTWRPGLVAAAAAVLGLAIGAGATALLSDRAPAETVLARADLAPLPARTESGSAVVRVRDGERRLSVDVRGLTPAAGSYYEVWLLAPDASRLVSLGVIEPGTKADLEIPRGLTLSEFPVVDVSVEPFDGNPAHSSVSVVRGALPA